MFPDSIKNFSLFSVLAFLIFINYSSCQLDDTTPNPTPLHNYLSFEAFFIEQDLEITEEKFAATDPIDFTSANGTSIQIESENLLLTSGTEPTDSITIRLQEFPNNSDLIMADLSLADDDGTIMKLAGLHTVTAKAANQTLGLDGFMDIEFGNAGTGITEAGELTIFHAEDNAQAPFLPETAGSTINFSNGEFTLQTDKIGKILAAKQSAYNNTTTISLTNSLEQEGLIEQRAYIVFKNFKGIKKLTQDGADFTTSGIPTGVPAVVVFMAMDNTYFHIATEEITTSESLTVDLSSRNYPPVDFMTLLRNIDDL
ncbi:MAG: hypothetical protein AB8F74_13425 [Saprospiraceae bacterium]